jgi:hypothetical protein
VKGLDLSEAFFHRFKEDLFRNLAADDLGRVAAGLVGDGSDCLGFDDELSRDHDWGPGFCVWLSGGDFGRLGAGLKKSYSALPNAFKGFERRVAEGGNARVGVFETGAFYKSFIGRPDIPVTLADWLRIPEKNLAAATSGRVFYDPLGEFSRVRAGLLGFYPDDVRLAKIGARCMTAGQAGQYNLSRCFLRGDNFAAQYAETKFCADIMSLVYLLNRRYAPYFKWLRQGLRDCPRLGTRISDSVSALVAAKSAAEKRDIVEEMCGLVAGELRQEGLSDSRSPFLLDHGPSVQGRIRDPALRALDVWAAP